MLAIGNIAPEFTQDDFNSANTGSSRFTLSDYSGKVVVLAIIGYQ